MKRLLSVALIVLVSLVWMVAVSSAADPAIQSVITQLKNIQYAVQELQATSNAGAQVKPKVKVFYLTSGQFSGEQATAACSSGFHMARIFEILDTSHLQYATGLPGAYADNIILQLGDGPSREDFGWVRTGYASSSYTDIVSPELSIVNCISWQSDTSNVWGTVARLNDNAVHLNEDLVVVASRQCNQPSPVWCVEDM